MAWLITIVGTAIGGIIAGIILVYFQKERIDAFLDAINLWLFSGKIAKKEAQFYFAQYPGHIGNFGSNLQKQGRSGKMSYAKLIVLPKTMENCVHLYKPDPAHEAWTWATIGNVLFEQARNYYKNVKSRKLKLLQLADKAFEKSFAIQLDPRTVNRRAQIQILLGHLSEAEEILHRNISKVKNEPNFYASLGNPQLQESYRISFYILGSLILGEFSYLPDKRKEAISLFSEYIALSSKVFYQFHVALSKRGTLYLMNGQFEEAEKDFEAVDINMLRPKVNVGFLHNNQFKLWVGQVNKAIAEKNSILLSRYWDKAEEAFRKAEQTHKDLQEETTEAYYEPYVETDLKQKYEIEFQTIVKEYYRLKSVLGR